MRWLKRLIVRTFAVLGVVSVVVVAALAVLWSAVVREAPRVPEVAVLELDLTDGLSSAGAEDGLSQIVEHRRPTLREVLEGLDEAGRDERIVGLVARMGRGDLGTATLQELRDAVIEFRATGKSTVAFAESFGAMGLSGAGSYYLATAFDEIWLQPSGQVGLAGLHIETTFLKGMLDKIGVLPRVDKRKAYKTAADILTDTEYSPAFRESLEGIATSIFDQVIAGIAAGRGLETGAVRALIDRGPFLAGEAADAKLVDGLAYRDQVEDGIKEKQGPDAEFMPMEEYMRRDGRPEATGTVVGLIEGHGPIMSGTSSRNGPFSLPGIGADSVTKAFEQAIEDEDIVAILFRVDSPGGSYVAADTIWRAVRRAREAGKPVVVSMGDVAASGGYFVAAPANRIIAGPATITGSIGVVAGKVVIAELAETIGVTTDSVQIGDNADMWSVFHDFSPDAWSRLQKTLDAIYEDFTTKVANGRGLSLERIPEVAEGRVWTGEDAMATGLVDGLGGYRTALAAVRDEAGLGVGAEISLKRLPKPKGRLRRLLESLTVGAEDGLRGMTIVVALANRLRPLAESLGLADPIAGPLQMPPVQLK